MADRVRNTKGGNMTNTDMRDADMAKRPVVGRFAPSPTGRMHLGNIFASLAAWLAVRSNGPDARLVLRIEDIDRPRAVEDADRWIMDDYSWLGLDWDGEPVYQSQRGDVYERALRAVASRVVDGERLAYPCFCTRRELRAASAPQESDGFVLYPGTCRRFASVPRETVDVPDLSARHSVRLAMPREGNPWGRVVFDDDIYGRQAWNLPRQVGDIVIRRSDGVFAYQLAVVADDLAQGVTQVVRGRDLLRSTAAQIWLREAITGCFGEDPARIRGRTGVGADAAGGRTSASAGNASALVSVDYAHLPLLRTPAGARLAKRDKSMEVATLRGAGARPEQVIGYCAWLLGLEEGAEPEPCAARDCVGGFSWDRVRRSRWGVEDRVLEPRALEVDWWRSWR